MADRAAIVFECPPLSMSVAEAATRLGVSRGTLEQIIERGGLRIHRLTPKGDRRVSLQALAEYIAAREQIYASAETQLGA